MMNDNIKPITEREILEALYNRIMTECKSDQGTVKLTIETNNTDHAIKSITDMFLSKNIPVATISDNKIRIGIVTIEFILNMNTEKFAKIETGS